MDRGGAARVTHWAATAERVELPRWEAQAAGRASSRAVLRVGLPDWLSTSGFDRWRTRTTVVKIDVRRRVIADPVTAHNSVASYQDALYLLLQLEVRRIVGGAPVDLKDLILPGDLKRMFAKVVEARQEGLAALEKARGETAALRGLTNAARLLEGSPALAQLRLLQHPATTSGNTYVLGVPSSVVPLPEGPA